MRVIGLDLGTRTCGIALSDPMGIIASGYENYRFYENDFDNCLNHVKEVIEKMNVDKIVYIPNRPTIMPAMWFIVRRWRGRKRRRKRLITSVNIVHHAHAPQKKPPIISSEVSIDATSRLSEAVPTPNIAKKARIYGITTTKLAIVKPNIEAKSFHRVVLPARLRRICGTGFWKKIKTPTITTKMPPTMLRIWL